MLKHIIRKEIDAAITSWLKTNGIDFIPNYTLEEPPKNVGGDLASNIAMALAKQLKKNPRIVAEELSSIIAKSLPEIVEKTAVAGAGFINLTIKDSELYNCLNIILEKKDEFGHTDAGKGRKALVEFVSANPTGPLHIGHGRGAAIGDSLARVFSSCGFSVEREYYLNDTGNQMAMLSKSVEARYRQINGETIEFPSDAYQGEYITDIAKKLPRQETSPDFKEFAVNEILDDIRKDLSSFDIRFDNWFSETDIAVLKGADGRTEVENVCEWLKQNGFAYEKEGALWFESTRYGDDKDRVLKRSDGRYTYLASDIAYHKNKLGRGYDVLVDLWGADHHGYVARINAAAKALGAKDNTLVLILYQLVSLSRAGVPVAMSTRSGEFITLKEVIGEVGKDACRFFFLLRAPDSQLEFDLELAKKQSSENPVFYVQYVHARSYSIFRESGIKEHDFSANVNFGLLKTPEERELIKKLIFFPDTIELCLKTLSPHHCTAYLQELADAFHRFYEKCRVLTADKELTLARLSLVRAVTIVIKNGLWILGVSAPEKM